MDIDVEVDVDIDSYFACLKGLSKSVQVLLNDIDRSSCGTDYVNSEIARPGSGRGCNTCKACHVFQVASMYQILAFMVKYSWC